MSTPKSWHKKHEWEKSGIFTIAKTCFLNLKKRIHSHVSSHVFSKRQLFDVLKRGAYLHSALQNVAKQSLNALLKSYLHTFFR